VGNFVELIDSGIKFVTLGGCFYDSNNLLRVLATLDRAEDGLLLDPEESVVVWRFNI